MDIGVDRTEIEIMKHPSMVPIDALYREALHSREPPKGFVQFERLGHATTFI